MTLSIYYSVTQIEALTICYGFSGTLTRNGVCVVTVAFSGNNAVTRKEALNIHYGFSGTLPCYGVNGVSMTLSIYYLVTQIEALTIYFGFYRYFNMQWC